MKDIAHLTLSEPPEILFYATDVSLCDKVYRQGLKRKIDPFITLYDNEYDARRTVTKNQTSLFAIIAKAMADDGYRFYHAETGEWLADEVPSRYILLQ